MLQLAWKSHQQVGELNYCGLWYCVLLPTLRLAQNQLIAADENETADSIITHHTVMYLQHDCEHYTAILMSFIFQVYIFKWRNNMKTDCCSLIFANFTKLSVPVANCFNGAEQNKTTN